MSNNPTTPAQIAERMSEAQRRIIAEMSRDYAYPMDQVAADAGVLPKDCRAIIRQFHSDGLADFGPLYNEDDNFMQGKGYWLSSLGLAVRDHLLSREASR